MVFPFLLKLNHFSFKALNTTKLSYSSLSNFVSVHPIKKGLNQNSVSVQSFLFWQFNAFSGCMVELEGFEPSSKQGTNLLSTCLSSPEL